MMKGVTVASLLVVAGALMSASPPAERPPILGIAHIAFQTSDLSKARGFYGGVLGFEEPFTVWRPDGSVALTYFKVNERQYIEITPGLPPDRDDRLSHVAFETTDVEKLRLYMKEKGMAAPDSTNKGNDGNLNFAVTDPDGHLIEFVQYQEGSVHDRARGRFLQSSRISDRLLHVGLTIADTGAADRFYREVLGFSEIWRGGPSESVTRWINMRVPEGTDYLEYMLVDGKVDRIRLGTLHHQALMVPDIQKALETVRLRAVGPRSIDVRPPQIGRNNRWQLNLYDPDGSRTELMEPYTAR